MKGAAVRAAEHLHELSRGNESPDQPRDRTASLRRAWRGAARWTRLGEEAGSSLVELAITAPLFILLLFWSVYFTELSIIKIRQQEASRFLTWEATTYPLSDFVSGNHGPLATESASQIRRRTERRYRNLEGHNEGRRGSMWIASPSIALESAHIGLSEQETDPLGHEILGSVERSVSISPSEPIPTVTSLLRGMEGALLPVLSTFGFNTSDTGVRSSVSVQVENRLLPRNSSIFPPSLQLLTLEPAKMSLEVETWDLGDGSDVGLSDVDEAHPFRRQVDRIALLGIGDKVRSQGKHVAALVDLLPVSLSAKVVSQRYGDPAKDGTRLGCEGALAGTGKWRNGKKSGTPADGMSPAKCFDTLPMEAGGLGVGYEGDPSFRQLRSRGEGYLGCSRVGSNRGGCDE